MRQYAADPYSMSFLAMGKIPAETENKSSCVAAPFLFNKLRLLGGFPEILAPRNRERDGRLIWR
jgi:hypothetical protein